MLAEISLLIFLKQRFLHIVVNDNIKSIGNNAFNSITTLETVSLPDTVTTCGDNVFAESSGNVTAYFRGVDGTVDMMFTNQNCLVLHILYLIRISSQLIPILLQTHQLLRVSSFIILI